MPLPHEPVHLWLAKWRSDFAYLQWQFLLLWALMLYESTWLKMLMMPPE